MKRTQKNSQTGISGTQKQFLMEQAYEQYIEEQ